MDLDILIKPTHFLSTEEESIASIQFNGKIINMMLPTILYKFYLTLSL